MMAPACWLQIVYCVITVIIALVSSQNYVLYEEELVDWEDGNAFCAFSYGTSLASIHDATEDSEAGSKCTSSDCWIGATTLDSVDWSSYDGIGKWRDETIFDYGNDTLCGIPPWKDGNPSTVDSNGNLNGVAKYFKSPKNGMIINAPNKDISYAIVLPIHPPLRLMII
eukprot:901030_1